MEIKEFLFRKDNRVITVPFPARDIVSVKCTECGFDGFASQLIQSGYINVKCPVCGDGVFLSSTPYLADGRDAREMFQP
jgi:predicted RNA-binding Zn-ribbon protein involved in translation (DUF1610 family)